MAIPKLTMNDGGHIPQIGLGLWKVRDEETFKSMFQTAIEAGYSHFDTAQAYHNETLLGACIKQQAVDRSKLFITTKVAVQNFGRSHTTQSFKLSLQRLQMDYVDLLLIHFPVPILRTSSWRALEAILSTGQAKHIGVSNFTVKHLASLARSAGVTPAVNQVEMHVFLQQPELLAYCQDKGIIVEAYSPLAHSRDMANETISRIASKHHKSYAQIMLAWCIAKGLVVLPKSSTPARVVENAALFDFTLDQDDMIALQSENRNLRTCWNPTHVP